MGKQLPPSLLLLSLPLVFVVRRLLNNYFLAEACWAMSLEPPLPTKVNPSKALSSDPKYAPLTSGDTTVDGYIHRSVRLIKT